MSTKELLTAHELAALLGLSVETIWRYTREGKIPFLEIGSKQYRYQKQDVLDSLAKAGSYVSEEQASYTSGQKFTYDDYALLPPEMGYSIQLIDGIFVREPSPRLHHQRVSIQLQILLLTYFQAIDPGSEVLDAPLDLYLNEHTVVQPDLLYFPSSRPARQTPILTIPELIVEILSSTSVRTDRVKKLNLYQKAQVPHYWIVDPEACIIECYELHDGRYFTVPCSLNDKFTHPSFPDLTFNIMALLTKPPYSLE